MSLAAKLRQKNRTHVTLSTGDVVEVRGVTQAEVTARLGGFSGPLVAAVRMSAGGMNSAEILQGLEGDQVNALVEFQHRYEVALLCLGVTSLKVVDKPAHELADDEILPTDLGADRALVLEAIQRASGLVSPEDAERFRTAPVDLGAASGDVPHQAIEPVAQPSG